MNAKRGAYQYTLVTPVAVREFASLRALKTWALLNLGAEPSTSGRWLPFPQWKRPFDFPTACPARCSREMPLYGRVYGRGRIVAAIAFRSPVKRTAK